MAKSKNATCNVCRHSGLAFFFLRWGAIGLDSRIAPPGADAVQTDANLAAAMELPRLKQSRYVLRLLRPGYLHVYHEKAPKWLAAAKRRSKDKEAKHWEEYRVTPSGALIPDTHASFSQPDDFHCTKDPTHIFTAMAYRLRDAHKSGKIWVAFSANRWNAKLRGQNKMNAEVMQEIDVPAVLAGKKPKNAVAPDAAWIDRHVAEFALPTLLHGGLEPTLPFKVHLLEGTLLAKKIASLDGADAQTKGKSLAFVLHDAVGAATDLADISRARYQKGVEYAERYRQPASTAAHLKGLEAQSRRIEEARLAEKPGRGRRMNELLRTDARGQSIMPDGNVLDTRFARSGTGALAKLPPANERQNWEYFGDLSADSFIHMERTEELPKSAILFPYAGSIMISGPVFAPVKDMDQQRLTDRTNLAMAKMNRLHRPKDVTKFIADFDGAMKKHQDAVSDIDADRQLWLTHDGLRRCFLRHYDPTDNNEQACVIYMDEVSHALISWGGVSASLEDLMDKLLDAQPEGMDGWALRAMVGNQKGVYSQMTNLLSHMGDWTSNEDAKLDKTYDSLKFALFEEVPEPPKDTAPSMWIKIAEKVHLVARYEWMKPAGAGLSFGIMGFMSGAAMHLLSKTIAQEAPNFAKNFDDQMEMMAKFVDGKTGALKNKVVDAQLKRSMKMQMWCHDKSLLLDGLLNKKPPARPVYARVSLTIEQAVGVLIDFRRQGDKFNQSTRQALKAWKTLPDKARNVMVELDFLTTDVALTDAGNIKGVTDGADHVRVSLRGQAPSAAAVMSLTAEQLGELYRQAHRYDGLKKALVDLLGKTAPQWGNALNQVSTLPAKVGVSAARGFVTWQGQFSLWGAVLQWRGLMRNWTKLDNLKAELEQIPNLTDEQKAAINDEMTLTQLGMVDNMGGIVGGLSDLSAVGASALKLAGTTSLMRGLSAFGGSAGSFVNAWQNLRKAEGKLREGEVFSSVEYYSVVVAYGVATTALFLNGVAIIAEWLVKRLALRLGMSIGAMITFGATRFSWIGWAATIIAFIVEGVVNWRDRTKMEAWVENSWFGDKKFKSWQDEEAAYDDAMKDMQEQALRQADGTLPEGAK